MPNSRDHAVVIGINHYASITPLDGPARDASEFVEWLKTKADVPAANITTIPNSPQPLLPIQDTIDEAITEIVRKGKGQRRFYFFFAGHGIAKAWDTNGLCLPKWSQVFSGAALSVPKYRREIVNSGAFEEVVFFLDSCSDLLYDVDPQGPLFRYPAPPPPVAASFVAYASDFDNQAREAMIDVEGRMDVRGIFSTTLLAGLNGEAIDENGDVTTDSLKDHLNAGVTILSERFGKVQSARYDEQLKNPIVLVSYPDKRRTAAGPVLKPVVPVVITLTSPGTHYLLDHELNRIHENATGKSPWNLELPTKSMYAIQRGDGDPTTFLIDGKSNPFTYEY